MSVHRRVDVGIDPYNGMRSSTAKRRNSLPLRSTARRDEVIPPYEIHRTLSSQRRADRVVRPYNEGAAFYRRAG